LVAREQFIHFGHQSVSTVDDPGIGVGEPVTARDRSPGCTVHEGESAGVPQLVAEVSRALRPLLGESDVHTGVGAASEGEPQRISTILIKPIQRVDHVALRFGHFLTVGVTDEAVKEYVVKWWPATHHIQTEHHHPNDPEKEDVVAGNQNAGRVEPS
jgi:hypothetical protein